MATSRTFRSQLYLIMREAVRNAVKHSGCHHLTVEIEALPGKVFGSVGDDGRGFDAEGAHDGVGLESMRERAELLNGDLRLVPGPDGGTMVEVSVPLLEPPEEQ
ncbi:MAG: ATP-binding protein [Rubrobacteraceae bacterium]